MGTIKARRGKRGTTYRVRVELPRDPATGERRWRSASYKTRREAETAERDWEAELAEGRMHLPSRMALGDFLGQWLASSSAIRDNTWLRHEQDVRIRILPQLGGYALREIDAWMLQSWVDGMAADFSPATVARAYVVLHRALNQAVAWRLLPANPAFGVVLPRNEPEEMRVWDEGQVRRFLRATQACPYSALWRLAALVGLRKGEILALNQAVAWRLLPANPAFGVVLPRNEPEEMRVWDEGQVRRFLRATRECPYSALWRLAALVGLRKGEILALQWRDLDAGRRTLQVRRTLTRDRGHRRTIGPPKTRAGTRSIALPEIVAAACAARRDSLGYTPDGEEWLFLSPHTHQHLDTNLPNTMLDRYIEQANREDGRETLTRIRFHDLRHTAATLALTQGVSPRVVQERLGHASLAVTLGLYSHVTLTLQTEAADRMDRMFG